MSDLRYRPEQRVRQQADFRRDRSEGLTFHHGSYVLRVLPERKPEPSVRPRFAVITSRKVGKAHDRNRVRRRWRELFRLHQSAVPAGYYLLVIAKKTSVEVPWSNLCEAFRAHLDAAQARLKAPPVGATAPQTIQAPSHVTIPPPSGVDHPTPFEAD